MSHPKTNERHKKTLKQIRNAPLTQEPLLSDLRFKLKASNETLEEFKKNSKRAQSSLAR